jgi:hypothetical protein
MITGGGVQSSAIEGGSKWREGWLHGQLHHNVPIPRAQA